MYQLRSPNSFLMRHFGEESVVYVLDARETHLLTASCAHVLGVMARGAVTFEDLRAALSLFLEDSNSQEATDLLHQILASLGKIGFLETPEVQYPEPFITQR